MLSIQESTTTPNLIQDTSNVFSSLQGSILAVQAKRKASGLQRKQMTNLSLAKTNFSWRWSWLETTPSCSQGTSVLTVLPLGKWGLVMGLLTLPQHPPCPRRPFSTFWYKQKRMGLYKKSSFDPDSHQLYLHQHCLPPSYDDSESPGNGHVPDITMLSASSDQHWRTKGGVGREKGPARQDERTWPRFLMGGTGGGKRKQENPLLPFFNHINSA